MKPCPGCGEGFIGVEPLCMVCRRKPTVPRTVASKVPAPAPGHTCPTCGQKVKPPAMTGAERQRRYRERKNGR